MGTVGTIGFFDGVHLGHQFLLQQLVAQGIQKGLKTLVVTFEQAPKAVLDPSFEPLLLTSTEERKAHLLNQGIDEVCVLDFQKVRSLTREAFLRFLRDQKGVEGLLLGYDHRFGSDGNNSWESYAQIANALGIELLRCEARQGQGTPISSTRIRQLLLQGEVEQANQYLGYSYALKGTVEQGQQLGRVLGFPTANLHLDDAHKLVPKAGVYAARCEVAGKEYKALLNIGNNPTVGGKKQSIEAYLLHFEGNLYGQTLSVSLDQYLREEHKFESLAELTHQMEIDLKHLQGEGRGQ